eukprot:TRINITY_DN11451_c0_g1_i1.p1 TRINITY_DN11451_c0_g1~~TRINITY_DN11451_c0_g1_i1.p1  ORF type:complete len:269 (+),score=83.92 TRINITY_DN11451_c0_g1_i1:151-957(+)
MAYVASKEYSPVSTSETVVAIATEQPSQPSAELAQRIRSSSRVVAFFCFVQLVLSAIGLFTAGNIFQFCFTAVFVSLGLAGVAKRRPRLLIAHFVYSIIIYILTLIAMIYIILYCDDCGWTVYAIIGLYVIIQAIGLKHSRLLIWAINTANGTSFCGSRPARETTIIIQDSPAAVAAPAPVLAASAPVAPARTQSVVQQSPVGTQSSTVSVSAPTPTAPMQPMMMYPPLPQFQPYGQNFPMQPYPFQPYPYPMVGQVSMVQQPTVQRQ